MYKKILPIAFVLAAQMMMGNASAENFPGKSMTIILPQAAGGASDVIARIFANKLGEVLGQSVLVENRPGAGGNVGVGAAKRAAADGYTLLVNVSSAHLVNPFLYENAGYEPEKDFIPIAPLATGGMVLVANPSLPVNNVPELIEYAKAQPENLYFASAGNGTLNHLLGVLFQKDAGIKLTHVPYKGAAAATTDVIAGRVPLAFQALASSLPHIRSGSLKVLGVVNPTRQETLPDVPSISESLPGYGVTPWYGLFAPAGLPSDRVEILHSAAQRVLQDPEIADKLTAQGAKPYILSQEEFTSLIKQEIPRWKVIVEESAARLD